MSDELTEAEAYAREKAAKNWRAPSLIGNVTVALIAEIDRRAVALGRPGARTRTHRMILNQLANR